MKLRDAIAAGRASFGSWISISDPVCVEMMGKAGFDWVILDTQHGGINWDNLLTCLQALDLGGTRAFVRVGWNDPMQIMRAMDLGAVGVVVPMISTAEQARLAAQAMRYPPLGFRSFGRVRSYYGNPAGPSDEPLCMVMIETAEALQNLDSIAAAPGVDGLFVGPVDLALSLGLGPALQMPGAVVSAIGDVVDACRRHGKIPGAAALGEANAKELMERGAQFLTLGSDSAYIRRGAAADVEKAHQWVAAQPTQ